MNTRTTILQLLAFALIGTAYADEIWIAQVASGSPGGSGTITNPYTIPTGNSTQFDTLLSGVSANTTIHVGAGTFLVQGVTSTTGVELKAGCSLVGSGIGVTTIKLVNSASSSPVAVIQMTNSGVSANASGTVRDLTVDCNAANQTCAYMDAVVYQGAFALIENVEIINLGSISGEGFGIFGGNFDAGDVAKPSQVIIRNCKVVKPWTGASASLSAISPGGHNDWSAVVEGCYVDLSTATSSSNAGLAFAGAPRALVISHNTAIGLARGIHIDTAGSYSPKAASGVVITHNHCYDCLAGIGIGLNGSNTAQRTDAMEKFLIEGNVIEMKRGGNGIELWGDTTAFQVKNNTITKNPSAPSSTYRTGIYVSSGAQSHVITGNRFDFSGDPYFTMINPYSTNLSAAASLNNRFEDNTFMSETLVPKLFSSIRQSTTPGVTLPTSGALWQFGLGGGQGDSNPTTELVSSDLDGSNRVTYMRVSPLPGNWYSGNARILLDSDGAYGVYVGGQYTGDLGAGGWIWSNTGVGLPQGSRAVILEGGTKPIMGTVTLSSGTATVSTTAAKPTARIFLTQQQDGGTPGAVRVSSRSPGTSFTITSTSATDASIVAWLIIDSSY